MSKSFSYLITKTPEKIVEKIKKQLRNNGCDFQVIYLRVIFPGKDLKENTKYQENN
jgi:hypothetical protein